MQLHRYYPDTLHKLYLVNVPRLFSVGWKMLQPALDPITWAKITVLGTLHDDVVRRKLLELGVDEAFLERQARGKRKCDPI